MSNEEAISVFPALPDGGLRRLLAGVASFRKLIDNPADPVHGPRFQMCVERGLHRKLARMFRASPEGRRLLEERPRINVAAVSLFRMSEHPEGTLGEAYGRYFAEHGIAPFESPDLPFEADEDYVCTRLRESHDVVHVLTGYGTDEIGELELQCFELGNMPVGPIPFFALIGAWVTGVFRRHGGLRRLFGRFRAAYRAGRSARLLASVIWEDHWRTPLADLRNELLGGPARPGEGAS